MDLAEPTLRQGESAPLYKIVRLAADHISNDYPLGHFAAWRPQVERFSFAPDL